MPFTFFRFLLLLALLLLGRTVLHAQSISSSVAAPPTPASPDSVSVLDARYASANEVSELKAQLNTLLQAYDQLVTRYNTQSSRLLQLERATAPAPAADRRRLLRSASLPGSY